MGADEKEKEKEKAGGRSCVPNLIRQRQTVH